MGCYSIARLPAAILFSFPDRLMMSNNPEKQDGKARILFKPVFLGGLAYGSLGTRSVSHELEPKIFPFWPSHSINKCVLKRIIFLSSDNALN